LSLSRFDAAQIAAYQSTIQQPSGAKRSGALPPPPPEAIAKALGVGKAQVTWLAGDGSDRCYYRVSAPELKDSLVLMQLSGADAKALKEDGYDWVKIAALLYGRGVFVPRVIATMPEHAALVIEDYGNTMLEGVVFQKAEQGDFATIRGLYRRCAEIVASFVTIPRSDGSPWCRRSFDAERYTWELNFFVQKYAGPVAKVSFSAAEQKAFDTDVKALAETLADNAQYFVHRDFHSRNIMVKGETLAIIDFQDARLGPAAYDLVSLVHDSYVPFSGAMRQVLEKDAIEVIAERCGADTKSDVERLWAPMLLQRQLKAIGSFGFLTIDKQRGDYLKYVDPALRTLEERGVGDDRWPFLSRTLIECLRAHVEATRRPGGERHG
jgi:aminoglycoside/choline kinase family phosphotransferase